MDSPTINPEQPEFHYHYPQTLSAAPRAHAPAVFLLMLLLVTAVIGLTAVFVYPLRYRKAKAKQASEVNTAAHICRQCAQSMLDDMDKDGTLSKGRYILSSIPGKKEKNLPAGMEGLQETFDKRLHTVTDVSYEYLVVVEGREVTYTAVALEPLQIGTYPSSPYISSVRLYRRGGMTDDNSLASMMNRSEIKDFKQFYDLTLEAVYSLAE